MKVLVLLLLVVVAAVCGFGYLASGEPGTPWVWKLAYGGVGVAALAGAALLLVRMRR